ncbi:MAG: dihydrolipoamide acetyltransferase family protein [Candidatus Binatia bacterium]
MLDIRLPEEAWQDVEAGTEALVDQWLVGEGHAVSRGQAIAVVVLVKTTYELAAHADGTIARILVPQGETFGRGSAIGQLAPTAGGAGVAEERGAAGGPAAPLAADAGSGAGEVERIPFTGLRGAVARAMTSSWQTAPRVAVFAEVETSACDRLIETLRRSASPPAQVSLTHVILRAVALTLKEHPRLNGRVAEGGVEIMRDVHLGLAVNLDDGLVVPVIRNADRRSIPELAREAQQLAETARGGRLEPAALQGGTFTLSNLGPAAIDAFTPIINPPQIGILGVGRRAPRAIVRDGVVVAAPTIMLTLVFDHRAIDGYPASLFLAALRTRLERADDL